MAYQGRKVFQAGEVLASSDMNSTVDQTVMVFADATARNTAIPSPTEGMLVYLKDTDEVLKYDASNWVNVTETADDLITTEGDLIIGGTNGVAERLAIGPSDSVLSSDGTNISWVVSEDGVASNNFVIDMNDTTNNAVTLSESKPLGNYTLSLDTGDNSFDIYLLDANGDSVGYSNTASITVTDNFVTVVILGVATNEIVSFTFAGTVSNTTGEGNQPGAGAYLESITPTDLPDIDDTATITGGNFGANTAITFESGATVLPAKSITLLSGTELLVSRPDALTVSDAPWDVKAVNPGVTTPTSLDFVLTDEVTAGSEPTWVTTSPLNLAPPNAAFSQTLEATDSDGTVSNYQVTAGSLTTGLSLNQTTGVLSGTSTANDGDVFTFTVRATDAGGNFTDREFTQTVSNAVGGTISTDASFQYHTFTSGDDFGLAESTSVEYLVVAGGGGGGSSNQNGLPGGGGGAGGLITGSTTLSAGFYSVSVGAGGPANTAGGNSQFETLTEAIGGGRGGPAPGSATSGGSGGGGSSWTGSSTGNGATGTAGQGNQGGDGTKSVGGNNNNGFFDRGTSGGGGGAGNAGGTGNAGAGIANFSAYSTATGIGSGTFAAGGLAASNSNGSNASIFPRNNGPENTGAGGGGDNGNQGTPGRDGVVIVRFAI
jgi:hypothetical protein